MNKIQIKNITKKYNNLTALDDVSFSFEFGKIYGLLGRNGAGKSTLINIIANRIFADEGMILVDDIPAKENMQVHEKVFCMSEADLYDKDLKIKVGFVTRGRGMSIHRTDCINMLHLSDVERARLIDAEWEDTSETEGGGKYLAELKMYANDRQGFLMDISKVFTEAKIDVKSMNVRTSKKGTATIDMGFIVNGREELHAIIEKLRQLQGVLDIERTTG